MAAGSRQTISGGCACGAVRYEAAGPVRAVDACHCGQCRRACGVTPVVWATLSRPGFRWSKGEPRYHRSSSHGRRGFCPECGTPLSFESARWPEELEVTLGSLDDPEAHPPRSESHVRDKLSWVRLDPALEHNEGEMPDDETR